MSLMPAQRLEKSIPDANRLGRLQEEAQADVVVFDPESVQDRATFRAPTEASVGVRYLLVAGTVVVEAGRNVDGAAPGRALVRKSKSQ
jgi:N-acyl-D-aspartate/D-glutamate deacylase